MTAARLLVVDDEPMIRWGSAWAEEPFMEMACTAMPETLLESELFGREKGACTDAKAQKKGFVQPRGRSWC